MLTEHYKLAVQPFGVTPDPRFLYLSATHREAMASLLYGIQSGRGFTVLIAEPGMGKTTLLFNLLRILEGSATTAFLFQTPSGPGEFLTALLDDLGIADDGNEDTRMQAKFNDYLLRHSRHGREVVVIIDEAQNLNEQVLEVVRMLSNFETADRKLLHIVLAGQLQFAEKLNSGSLTQLRQRISTVARLAPLDVHETREYIEHRLKLAGHTGKPLFSNAAYTLIAKHSQGIPRNISNLCFNALSLGCALKSPVVDSLIVQEVVKDLDLGTMVASSKKSDDQNKWLPPFSRGVLSSARWQRGALLATVVLISLLTPISRIVAFAKKQFLTQHSERAFQPETNRSFEIAAAPGVPVLEAKKNRPLRRTSRPALIVAKEAARTKTPSGKSGTGEEAPGAADESYARVTQNTSARGAVDTAGHDQQRLSDELEFDSLLNEVGLASQSTAKTISVRQQPAPTIQSAPQQNLSSPDFQAQKVTQ